MLLHVCTYETNKLSLSVTDTYTLSLLGHSGPDCRCVYYCVCVWESWSLSTSLSLSVVSDILWLAKHNTSFVKVPVVLKHNVGEKRGSYDREKDWTLQQGFGQRGEGGIRSLLEVANEQRRGWMWEMRKWRNEWGRGGLDEEQERSCRCSRRPAAAVRRSCHSPLCTPQL